jgi:uncharacterized DUF497 family protein
MIFSYDDWNRQHVSKHGVQRADAEYVVEHATPPYPQRIEGGKLIVYGPDRAGRILEVVFAFRSAEDVDFDSLDLLQLEELSQKANAITTYIIHAMPVGGRGKKRYRRRKK